MGVRFRLDPGWHLYWKNPGESGLPTEVSWDTPGTTVDALQWPSPRPFRTPDGSITTYGYADEVLLFATARASEQAQGALMLSVAGDALCEVRCLPAQLMYHAQPAGGGGQRAGPEAAALLDAAALQVPREAGPAGYRVEVALEAPRLTAGKPFAGTLTLAGPALPRSSSAYEEGLLRARAHPGVAKLALAKTGKPGTFRLTGEAELDLPPAACEEARACAAC